MIQEQAEIGWNRLELAGIGWNRLKLARMGWNRLKYARMGWNRLKQARISWNKAAIEGNMLEQAGNGWNMLEEVRIGCNRQAAICWNRLFLPGSVCFFLSLPLFYHFFSFLLASSRFIPCHPVSSCFILFLPISSCLFLFFCLFLPHISNFYVFLLFLGINITGLQRWTFKLYSRSSALIAMALFDSFMPNLLQIKMCVILSSFNLP